MIRRIGEVLTRGTKLFNGHNEDNSTTDRKPVGVVLGKATKNIGGKLRTIAIAAMGKEDAEKFDICSIEAEVQETDGYVGDVDQVTAIAVSNSLIDQPAFQNAKRMQIVQCFDLGQEGLDQSEGLIKDKNMAVTPEDLNSVPLHMLKNAVKDRNLFPNQLYTLEEMEQDREFGKVFKERNDFKAEVAEKEKVIADTEAKFSSLSKEVNSQKALERLEERLPKDMTETQRKYATSRFDASALEELSDKSLDEYIESSKTSFQKDAELFGVKPEELSTEKGQGEAKELSLEEAFDGDE